MPSASLSPSFTRMTEPPQGTCALTTWPGFAGNDAIAVVADRQILDDELEFAADAFHFPDLLAVFRDVHRVVLGAVADLVHDSLEDVATDFLDQGSSLVENLDVRRIERVD